MKSFLVIFFAMALSLAGVNAVEPGLKFVVTPTAFNDFTSNFLPQLLSQLCPITIPDTTVAGFSIKNIVIEQMSIAGKATKVTFGDGKGIFSTQSFALKMKFLIDGKILGFAPVHFTTGGSSSNSEFLIDVSFGYKDSFVQINLNDLKLSIKNLVMVFPPDTLGSIVSQITNLLRGPIEQTVSYLVSNVLKGTFQNLINNLFTQIPKVGPIPGTPLGINFQATEKPKINPTYLVGRINGTIFNTKTGFKVPAEAPVVTPDFDSTSGKTVQTVITDYTLNSFIQGYWESGAMIFNVTNSIIPPEAGLRLTVGWLKQFIPNIVQYFSNEQAELIMNMKVIKTPAVKTAPADIQITAGVALTFYVISSARDIRKAVSVESTFTIHVNATIENWVLKPYIISGSFGAFKVLSSNVGTVDPTKFQTGFNIILMFALPGFNFAQPAFPLPAVPGVNLKSLVLITKNRYLQAEVTPIFTTLKINDLFGAKGFSLADFVVPFEGAVIEEEFGFLTL